MSRPSSQAGGPDSYDESGARRAARSQFGGPAAVSPAGQVTVMLARIRQRWWLVVAVALVALVGSTATAVLAGTTYTGRSALTVASQTRAPEQDAYLAQAYSEYFNQPSYQSGLADRAGLPAGVSYNARTAATSPIVYIEATTDDPKVATDAASRMADAFRTDLNAGIAIGPAGTVSDMQKQIATNQGLLQDPDTSPSDRTLITQEILSLQDQIARLQTDTTNKLQTLQRDASVSSTTSSPVRNGLIGLLGGLVFGCALALVVGAFDNRLVAAHQVRDKLGLDMLATVGRGERRRPDEKARAEELRRLTTVVNLSDFATPLIIAVASPREFPGRGEVAEALARNRARQGERTLLIRTEERDPMGRTGLTDYLAAPSGTPLGGYPASTDVRGLQELPAGSLTDPDIFALYNPERVVELLEQARTVADLVVVDCPPLLAGAEGPLISSAADHTILVLAEGATRVPDAVEARKVLDRVHANVLGAVLARPRPKIRPSDAPSTPGGSAADAPKAADGTAPKDPSPGEPQLNGGPRPNGSTRSLYSK
jgi:polysaccharide biosynthesis transport protein